MGLKLLLDPLDQEWLDEIKKKDPEFIWRKEFNWKEETLYILHLFQDRRYL